MAEPCHKASRLGTPRFAALLLLFLFAAVALVPAQSETKLPPIKVDAAGTGFVADGKPFRLWGVNYDHAGDGRLLEEYWAESWDEVVADFGEIRELGANVVRIHLQVGAFMRSADEPNPKTLKTLGKVLDLAESNHLYLDITGLGCYHKDKVPDWYNALDEAARWDAQAVFWKAVAETCRDRSVVFCFDLMNEPVLPGKTKVNDWLPGEPLGGKHFVQLLGLELGERSRKEMAKAWVDKLTTAIREVDKDRLITVGVIPWAHTWPNAKPLFYSPEVGGPLDFASVHFYPQKGKVPKALAALKVYEVGKPLVIEEMFPLKCGFDEMEKFLDGSEEHVDGWMSFYWGETEADYAKKKDDMTAAIMGKWLKLFRERSERMKAKEK